MTIYIKVAALSIGAAFILTSCGGSSSDSAKSGGSTTTSQSSSPASGLHVGHTSLGDVLVDGRGMTVYMLTSDKPDKSRCSAQCLAYWPPVAAPKSGSEPPGVTAALSNTTSTSGSSMATAGGWPLYTYVGDKAPGAVTGEGIPSFGGVWYALSPAGKPVKSASTGAAASSAGGSSGRGGY
jgi:predicted lipoprotein with Yx(FWY)xxD motif